VYQRPHDVQIIVHALQENALVSEWYSMVYQTFQSGLNLDRQLARMIDVNAHPEWVKFLEHLAQFGGDPLRQEDRDTSPDPDELYMFDPAQTAQDAAELVVGKE
jgi:hypothetical protein